MSAPDIEDLKHNDVTKQPSQAPTGDHSRFERALEIETVGVIFFDPAGDIIRANDAFLRMGGYSRQDVAERRLRWDLLTPPEWMEASLLAIAQLKTSGSTVPYEKQYYRKDGSRFWGLFAAKGISEHEGVEFIIDITERKRAEEELQRSRQQLAQSEAQLRLITDSLPALIVYFDENLRFVRVNQACQHWCGRGAAEIVGHSAEEILGALFARLKSHLELTLAGQAQNYELTIPEDNDTRAEERVLSITQVPDVNPGGEVCGMVMQARDITRRKQEEKALRTAEKLAIVGRLAASIAHEINNPLSSVTNAIYLARHAQDLETAKIHLDMAERELRRVSVISSETLRFQRQSPRPKSVMPEELLESVLTLFQGRLVNSRIAVEKRSRAQKAITCFEDEIRQVLTNLVANAIDAMHPRGGRLLIRSHGATNGRTGEEGVRFTVADSGAGMSQQSVRKLFEPFFTTKGASGTGLGLWISKDIVNRHRGTIRVRTSQRPGRAGTVFTLFVPLNGEGIVGVQRSVIAMSDPEHNQIP